MGEKSVALFERAREVMVGGVNSPVRAFKAVGGSPLFIAHGEGSKIWDVDGNELIDYVCSWGPLIAGHRPPRVMKAVTAALEKGVTFGAPTEPELRLAEKVCSFVPSIEKVRFVNSGTEATMSALRLARGYTKRDKVLKFEGCYHGHADPFLTQAGSGMATFDSPYSDGVPPAVAADTVTIPYNDLEAVRAAFKAHGKRLAAAIVEPVAGNMGVVLPLPGFLETLSELCATNGALLIFDEVITGFRLSAGGAQQTLGVTPDITCLGKIVGGGFPVGAYGASREIMRSVSPEGGVYQAGTLSGNPVAMTAGLETISLVENKYKALEAAGSRLEEGIDEGAEEAGVPVKVNRAGSMIGLFFVKGTVTNFKEAKKTKQDLYRRFHRAMLRQGVYLPPSPFETFFLSTAHTKEDLAATVAASRKAFMECRSSA